MRSATRWSRSSPSRRWSIPPTSPPRTTPDELGLDSLALVEVVFGIEEAFDISVPYNANDPAESQFDLSNVGAIVDAVKQLIAEKEQA